MARNSKKFIITVAAAVLLLAVIVLMLPAFFRARTTSAPNACINSLRQIDGAKQQWAMENRKTTNDTPSWDDIRIYVGRGPQGEIPKCPQGGTYVLGKIGELPRCSLGATRAGRMSHTITE
jgi:hypothetical protein